MKNTKKWFILFIATASIASCSISFGMNIWDAIKGNDISRAKELVWQEGFDFNQTNQFGETPLNFACWNNNLEILRLLLNHGAKESINKAYGYIPLYKPCENNNLEMVRLLLPYCSIKSINKTDYSNKTPLYFACENNNLEIVKLLLPYCSIETVNKADSKYNMTPLYWACKNNNLEIVKLLLEGGAKESVNKADLRDDMTPLDHACNKNNLEIIKLLLPHCSIETLNKAGSKNHKTPLYFACLNNNIELIRLFLPYCSIETINKADYFGKTLLHWACDKNNIEIVRLLLPHFSIETVNNANNNSTAPLYWASCLHDNLEMVRLLLEWGTNIDKKSLERVQENVQDSARQAAAKQILATLNLTQRFDKWVKNGQWFDLTAEERDMHLEDFVKALKSSKRMKKQKDPAKTLTQDRFRKLDDCAVICEFENLQ